MESEKRFMKMKNCLIIAEAGVNHNGSLKIAKNLIDTAKEAKADAIKFQTFKTENLVTTKAQKAEYQIKNSNHNTQYEMLKSLELTPSEFKKIAKYAQDKEIIFLSSPFDIPSANLLEELNLPLYKIGSGEITNFPLLKHVAKKQKPIILSTGMSTMGEIEEAIQFLEKYNDNITLMHCITSYPAPKKDINLYVIKTLKNTFKKPVGFSDHTTGIEISLAAVSLGSTIIEKHFTLDKNLPGPDHKASLEPAEFAKMVKSIRNIEKALGNGIKKPTPEELKIKKVVRKSIVSKNHIPQGTTITKDMLEFKRPGTGIETKNVDYIVGKKTTKDIPKDTLITWNQIT